jgi:hypothetical protein
MQHKTTSLVKTQSVNVVKTQGVNEVGYLLFLGEV